MAFKAKILSWRFRHLNIVGCLLKRRPTKGGSRAPQDPPSYAPELLLKHWTKAVDFRVTPSQPVLLSFTWFFSCPCAMFRPHVIGKEVT